MLLIDVFFFFYTKMNSRSMSINISHGKSIVSE